MSTLTRQAPGHSERDELERLQQELREVRRLRETLPRENAELASRVAQLEHEVRLLRRAVTVAHGEWARPAPSLPDRLAPPFLASPSRRTAYGRMRYAFRATSATLGPPLIFADHELKPFLKSPLLLGGLFLFSFALFYVFQGKDDDSDDDMHTWRFDEKGFSPVSVLVGSGKVLYSEIEKVEVKQGWLQRLFGFGSVRITWKPTAPTSLGKAVEYPNRVIDLDLLDDPKRLAAWVRERVEAEKQGGAHVD